MKLKTLRNSIASVVGAAALLVAGQASAVPVGLELMLLTDVSGSVDGTEYSLQLNGYVQAFQSAAVQNAIINSQGGGIAVTYIEWSGNSQRSTKVGWTLINDAASANAFAASLLATTRSFSGSTAIQDAIGLSYIGFGTEVGGNSNNFESARQVIDVSGDGSDNDSTTFTTAGSGRNAALAAGVDAVNGLPILGEGGLLGYYQNSVQGGTNSFTLAAADFASFATAIEQKLIGEIRGVPEPSSLALIGAALLGVVAVRRKATKS